MLIILFLFLYISSQAAGGYFGKSKGWSNEAGFSHVF